MTELELKYGCNPNQKPARIFMQEGELPLQVLNGRPGYINFMDALNSWQLVQELKQATGLPAVADDSGLCVDALNGAPGVYSARYAGENATDKDRCNKVLSEMHGVTRELRDARFVCTIHFIYAEDDEYSVRGEVNGYIGDKPKGKNGFGYDPIFMVNDDDSMADISEEEKNKISHRAMAFKKLSEILKEKFS